MGMGWGGEFEWEMAVEWGGVWLVMVGFVVWFEL
jgi:hypothetical protein